MSDEADVPEPKPGEAISEAQHAKFHWGVPISGERQAKLSELVDRQREWADQPEAARGNSVFMGVFLTGADVVWLKEQAWQEVGDDLHLETFYVNSLMSGTAHQGLAATCRSNG